MIKKLTSIFFIVFSIASFCFADEELPFEFYIPVQDEVNAFFNLISYLDQYNYDITKPVDELQIKHLLDIGLRSTILQTYYLMDFIRNTKNESATRLFINYCKNINELPIDYQITLKLLNERQDGSNILKNGKRFENIRYSNFVEISLFDETLNTMLPSNNWQNISITATANESKNIPSFITGGGSNSFLATYRYFIESEADFIKRVEHKRFDHSKYNHISLIELPIDSFLKLTNASKIYLWLGTSKDEFSIKSGQIVLSMYSEKYSKSFEITWLINFSKTNIFYENPEIIYSFMSLIILFSWID